MLHLPHSPQDLPSLSGEIRAAGTDVQERRRHHISHGDLIDIHRLPGLRDISWGADGAAAIGALVTLQRIADDPRIRKHYPGFGKAAGELATPQIRRVATLGGSLLQRIRCWYFRHPDFHCFRKGGDHCPARAGDHRYGVCFDLGPCVYPHPSTLGMALMVYDGEAEVHGRGRLTMHDLYGDGSDPHRDHRLNAGELLTHVHLPPPVAGERAAYFRATSRSRAEWPLVEAVARLVVRDGSITMGRVALGGVAPVPLATPDVDAALTHQPANEETLRIAAGHAAEGANPLPMTGYKVELLRATVWETLRRAMD